MIRILLVSDNHGDRSMIKKVLQEEPHCSVKVHCGDSMMSYEAIKKDFTYCVRGNNDIDLKFPEFEIFKIYNWNIIVVHGDIITYKRSNHQEAYAKFAKQYNCNVLLHGHIHQLFDQEVDGVRIISPGSLAYPRSLVGKSYMVLELSKDKILTYVKIT
ncbi:metallophosphoesterase family protein [Mycoplasma sp. SG1]|uniref:metallophosphoesterase family protein n=1 Tax=Mycoplasma sp. SG1 TaxID=2810348 RepID=UPI002024E7F6|nr:YfcE family phosphodiesterase [Mycoplasma sp. SG1]URM53216.1 YfcE family phosphodiesterase [Mycoplasma sp. SG1]